MMYVVISSNFNLIMKSWLFIGSLSFYLLANFRVYIFFCAQIGRDDIIFVANLLGPLRHVHYRP
jgi:hypothetical protein